MSRGEELAKTRAFVAAWRREAGIALLVGGPAVGYVLATNVTAPRSLVFLHVGVLAVAAPLAVAALDVVLPSPAMPDRRGSRVAREVGVRVVGMAAAAAAMAGTVAAVTGISLRALVGAPLVVALVPVFLAYALAGLAVEGSRLREHAFRLRASEERARHEALAARIRPHFLFNALNCIEELTDSDPPTARVAVGRLARLLRSVLASSSNATARMGDEAKLLDDYFGIERLRFGARFTYTLDVAPELAARELPSTVLLTLAENAVKHGVEGTRGAATVSLVARGRPDGGAVLRFTNPTAPSARGRGDAGDAGGAYGLRDVRERLALAYGDEATLEIGRAQGETFVELTLPR